MFPRLVTQSSDGCAVNCCDVNAGIGFTSRVDADAVENPTTATTAATRTAPPASSANRARLRFISTSWSVSCYSPSLLPVTPWGSGRCPLLSFHTWYDA
jgi:hypothetical protein